MRLMLVENQWIKMRWHYKNKSHFESKGYKFTSFGDDVMIKAEDLRPESHEKVMVKCDGCGEVFNRDFRDYVKGPGWFGAGIEYGFDTAFGPLRADIHWSSITNKPGFYISWGYDF